MTYPETITYLYNSAPLFQNIGQGAYKEGLSTTHALDKYFGHPHHNYRTLHVAGIMLAYLGGHTTGSRL